MRAEDFSCTNITFFASKQKVYTGQSAGDLTMGNF
jgi:hypothetical protein